MFVVIALNVSKKNDIISGFISAEKMKADYEYFWDFIYNGYPFTEVCERKGADLKKIKEWFKKNEIDFSKKHEDKIIELLKNNSIDYLLNLFQEQIDILKNKKDVKNIAAVFSAHLFKGTCEVNLQAIEQKELEQEKIKNEQRKEYQKDDKAMEVFKSLPTEQQLKIEDEIIEEFKNPALREIKKNTEVVYYLMISQKIKEKITELGLLSA